MKEKNEVGLLLKNAKGYFEIKIKNKINDEIGEQVDSFLQEHKRIYLEANPSYGKTYHIAQIGKAIKEGNSPYKRLIFCTPRLIIQEQFKSYDLKVDFELKGGSDIKKINDSVKIITSTFNSLHRIANIIEGDDLIVVDEAHIMLTNYNNYGKKTDNPYYEKLLQTIYNNNCSLILMSGTPTNNFNELLNLKHLKVVKENEDITIINIGHNHHVDTKELSYRYCQKYAEEFPDKLNVIYIKNVNDCGEIALYLADKGFNAKALTSKTKQGEVYLKIVEDDIIPKDIQFIITTNVLSVGTNINNENIGGVVMFNENDPLEIKQFAKRFRKAKNLTIDVINKVSKSFDENSSVNSVIRRLNIIEESKKNVKITLKQINYQKDLLQEFAGNDWKNFQNNSFDNTDFGTPRGVINNAIKRFLINEAYLYDRLVQTFDSPLLLKEGFAQLGYNDIRANISDLDKKLWEDHEKSIDKEAKDEFKKNYDSIIDDFIKEKASYCFYALTILEYTDFDKREKFKQFLNEHVNLNELKLDRDIKNTVNGILFKQYIIDPLIDYIAYFNDLELCLRFLKSVRPEERQKHILSLHINFLFNKYCEINDAYQISYKKGTDLFQSANEKVKDKVDIITDAYSYLMNCQGLYLNDFRIELMKGRTAKIINKSDKTEFPFNMIKDKRPSVSFLLGLSNGIFVLKKNIQKVNDKSGKRRNGYVFETEAKEKEDLVVKSTKSILKTTRSKNYTPVTYNKLINNSKRLNNFVIDP
jgi:hypothetical protein